MADNNVNISQDHDFYKEVRFFGNVTIKATSLFNVAGSITCTGLTLNGNGIVSGNLQALNITATGVLSGVTIVQAITPITASTPPAKAELIAELGEVSANVGVKKMIAVTDGTIYQVYCNGSDWYYSAYTVSA